MASPWPPITIRGRWRRKSWLTARALLSSAAASGLEDVWATERVPAWLREGRCRNPVFRRIQAARAADLLRFARDIAAFESVGQDQSASEERDPLHVGSSSIRALENAGARIFPITL